MAIKDEREGKNFCKFVHYENGKVWPRKVEEIHVFTHEGEHYVLTGVDLPTSVSFLSSRSHPGEHIAQLLLRPKSILRRKSMSTVRDAIHVVLGMAFAIGVMNFFIAVNGYSQ